MDNYTNNDQNSYGSSNGYPVDPNNNSYHYTGTDNTDNTSGNTYSSYSSYSSAQAGTDQSHDRYYSPYERRAMEEGNGKKRIDPLSFLRSRLANDHLFSPPNTGQILFSEADSCSRPLRRTR